MKVLILIALSVLSVNIYSAEVGEDQKGECIYANQDTKKKEITVEQSSAEESKKEESKSRSI